MPGVFRWVFDSVNLEDHWKLLRQHCGEVYLNGTSGCAYQQPWGRGAPGEDFPLIEKHMGGDALLFLQKVSSVWVWPLELSHDLEATSLRTKHQPPRIRERKVRKSLSPCRSWTAGWPHPKYIIWFFFMCVQKHVIPCYSKCDPRTSNISKGKQTMVLERTEPHKQ